MIRVLGTDGADDPNGKTGLFFSKKFFIPLRAERAYYLRIWEGKDEQTAPYYQDTSEYVTAGDRGGAIIRLQSGPPIDVDWSFGNAKPRPGAEPDSSKTKKSTSR